MPLSLSSQIETLPKLPLDLSKSTLSGLSSGAFMTVQMHLAHSAIFCGAGVVAGGPYRCAQSYRQAAPIPEDAYVENALFICMNPLTARVAPNGEQLAQLARDTAAAGLIDSVENLQDDRLYLFTGSADTVVNSKVVAATKRFYECLGLPAENLRFVGDIPAGHSLLTMNPEDNLLSANQPPYLNHSPHTIQSWDILEHLYGPLNPPATQPSGRMVRFEQTPFFGGVTRASMSRFGYLYLPKAVEEGAPARLHVAIHGCKQGYNYVNFVNGRRDRENATPYGNRYFTTTGYNEMADTNNLVVLYPQVEGIDDGATQNPEGCWDWWGYSSTDPQNPDYYSKDAVQIHAIYQMVQSLAG